MVPQYSMDFQGSFPIAKQIHFDHIDSTNTWALNHVEEWASQGITLVTASSQTMGRGRWNRRWASPPSVNLYASFCFWLEADRTDLGHLPQLLALAASKELEDLAFLPHIKWPNDILLSGKKVAGLLCETLSREAKRGIVCGIGINVNMTLDMLKEIDRPATSLLAESGHSWELPLLLEGIASSFSSFLHRFEQEGFPPFFPFLEERLAIKKGEEIAFHDNQTLIRALFESLRPDGSIELRLADGTTKIYHAGEFILEGK